MKILIFVHPYLNLSQPVVDELRNQGHEVVVIEDFFEYYDPKDTVRRDRLTDKKIELWNNSVSSFWRRHEDVIAGKYDMFISFNGWGINGTAFELINKYSPECVKVQYCWDSFKFEDLRMVEQYFDVLFTFDIIDARNPGWKLLPSFYIAKEVDGTKSDEEYDLFMIGANHDDRYSFVRKVLKGLDSSELNNYIKIYVPPINNYFLNFMIDIAKSIMRPAHIHELLFKYGYANKELVAKELVGSAEYADMMRRSKCILDDNRPGQAGLSPRFIRAMALNKKVITTNEWACQYSFVDENNVLIVNKEKPIIDEDFIRTGIHPNRTSNLDALELSNWVRILIGEIECPSFEKKS